MEFVQEAMEDGREDDRDAGQKCDAAEQGVTAGEDFSAGGFEFADWPHAGENHGRIYEGVDPAHVFK